MTSKYRKDRRHWTLFVSLLQWLKLDSWEEFGLVLQWLTFSWPFIQKWNSRPLEHKRQLNVSFLRNKQASILTAVALSAVQTVVDTQQLCRQKLAVNCEAN